MGVGLAVQLSQFDALGVDHKGLHVPFLAPILQERKLQVIQKFSDPMLNNVALNNGLKNLLVWWRDTSIKIAE